VLQQRIIEPPREARVEFASREALDRAFPALPDFFADQDETLGTPYMPKRVERASRQHPVVPADQADILVSRNPTDRVAPPRPERIERLSHAERIPVEIVVPEARLRGEAEPFGDAFESVDDGVAIVADLTGFAELQWSDTPRMCRTCRDFRPAESGERGWCTNKRAFSHRRMVDADELPCETSIGAWWLPHDDLWLSTLDISAHSQPTPLFDAWIAARVARIEGYEDEAPVRRRKRS
jgi:hypothetical protein